MATHISQEEMDKIWEAAYRDRQEKLKKKDEENSTLSANKKAQSPIIDLERVIFTKHAIDQFVRRWPLITPDLLKDPEKTAMNLLAGAREKGAISPGDRLIRLLNNGLKKTRYLENSGWRFVFKEEDDKYIVLTIERITRR